MRTELSYVILNHWIRMLGLSNCRVGRRDVKRCQPFISSFDMHTSPLSFVTFVSSRLVSPLPSPPLRHHANAILCLPLSYLFFFFFFPSWLKRQLWLHIFYSHVQTQEAPCRSSPVFFSLFFSSTDYVQRQAESEVVEVVEGEAHIHLSKAVHCVHFYLSSHPAPAQSKSSFRYRRKSVPKVEPAEDDTHLLYQDPDSILYRTDSPLHTGVPVLLVDGYNVCGYWPEVKKHFHEGKLEVARDLLIGGLVTFSSVREMKVVVVFDAAGSGRQTHTQHFAGVDIVFSGSADAWIEKEVVKLRQVGRQKVRVATSDFMQQISVNAAGAFVWSCKTLISEIKAAEDEMKMKFHVKRPILGRLLQHSLDPKVVNALKELRKKLAENETKGKKSSRK